MIQAVVGAGGKTSHIKASAKEYQKHGKKVFVTTSTHMFIEEDTLLTDDADQIIEELEKKHYVMAGIPEGNKISALSKKTYENVCEIADVVLVEADGSKQKPLKFPAEYEPVIYENVDEILVVAGLRGLNQKAGEVVHRLEIAEKYLDITTDTVIKPVHVQSLIKKGYLEGLHKQYPDKRIRMKVTHDGSLYQRVVARMLEEEQDISIIKEEWFEPQPQLIVCGAGHVAYELVKMASCLDFRIRVIDDREEFANKQRFDCADEVICDSFEHLEKYLDDHGYYVVVTRGHKADYKCVQAILSHSYHYLGMIGSKLKVKTTFENLRKTGVPEEQISTIHAPIGLPIKANTPAEIAVSILAEIIQEKNEKFSSFVSRELLNVKEKGTLCIIVEKKGSSPRGTGSMMFVGEKNIIDSIGGGAIEFAVIEDARQTQHIMVKEYQLNNSESAKLGMICGGSNKVLFIPIEG